MKRLGLYLISLMFPWIIIANYESGGAAVIAFILQIIVIGWPISTIWALRTVRKNLLPKKSKKKVG